MQLGIGSNAGRVVAQLEKLAKSDLPYVAARALNDTARDVHAALGDHMDDVFENPTRFTKGAFYIWYANKRTLTAEVRRKNRVAGRHYLEVQAEGGARPQTGVERLLAGVVGSSAPVRTVTPTRNAKKDRHGNWARGERNKILRAVQGQGGKAASGSAGAKPARKTRAGYFVPQAGSRLSRGVYRRGAKGDLTKILHFSRGQARYRKQFEPQAVAEDVVNRRYADHFRRRLTEVLKGGS